MCHKSKSKNNCGVSDLDGLSYLKRSALQR